jgi:hypothetical protein
MGKRASIKDTPSSSDEAAVLPTPVSEPDATVTPKMALAGGGPGKVEMAKIETLSVPGIETAEIKTETSAARKIELASIEAPQLAPQIEELTPPAGGGAAPADEAAPEPAEESAAPYVSRFSVLAAALALAAALGGMVGALAAYGLARPAVVPAAAAERTSLEDIQLLKENVVQARVELAALKLSIDSANRNTAAQLSRISERIDRVERSQAEPAGKLTKAVDTLERLSRGEASSKDVTGSLASPANGLNQSKPATVEGWVVRDVYRGTALIEGRMGVIEVDQGDVVPGLGRVDAIRKQDGRWVVVTPKGLIMPAR